MLWNRTWFFAFATMMVELLEPQIGSLAIVFLLLWLLQYCLFNPSKAMEAFVANIGLICLAVFAISSMAWSQYPAFSVYFGIQFLITILIAIVLASSAGLEVIYGLAIAFGSYVLVSLIAGKSVAWGNAGGQAFAGLNGGKSALGDSAALAVLLNAASIVVAFRQNNFIAVVVSAVLLPPSMIAVMMSRTTGAVAGLGVAFIAVVVLILYVRGSSEFRVLTVVTIFATLLTLLLFGQELTESALALVGKGADLTGRSYLWLFADRLIDSRPLLGLGYNGFWVQGNPYAEHLWAFGGIQSRGGFNFHNSIREALVSLGAVGLLIFGYVYMLRTIMMIKLSIRFPDSQNMTWLALLFYELSHLPLESMGLGAFNYGSIILYSCLSYPMIHALEFKRIAQMPQETRSSLAGQTI